MWIVEPFTLAAQQVMLRLSFREKVLTAGYPSTHIVFVKTGELALQFAGSQAENVSVSQHI